jgi:hypothetical protein
MLLDEAEAGEGGSRHADLEMVARAGRIHDLCARAVHSCFDAAAHLVGADHRCRSLHAATGWGKCGAIPDVRAQLQVMGGLAVLSHVQVLVACGWVTVIWNEVTLPLQAEKTVPFDFLKPGSEVQELEYV